MNIKMNINRATLIEYYKAGMPTTMIKELLWGRLRNFRKLMRKNGIYRPAISQQTTLAKLNIVLKWIDIMTEDTFTTEEIMKYMGKNKYNTHRVCDLLYEQENIEKVNKDVWRFVDAPT